MGFLGRYRRLVTLSPTTHPGTVFGNQTGAPEFQGNITSLPVINSSSDETDMRYRNNRGEL